MVDAFVSIPNFLSGAYPGLFYEGMQKKVRCGHWRWIMVIQYRIIHVLVEI